jgi:hypothetical protein
MTATYITILVFFIQWPYMYSIAFVTEIKNITVSWPSVSKIFVHNCFTYLQGQIETDTLILMYMY